MRVLAVDFGTSNTVAGLVLDDGVPRLVTIDSSPLVPSSVFLTDDGTLAVGRDADRQARIDPSRYEPHPKRRIDDGALLLGSTAVPVSTVIAAVLGRVAAEVFRQLGRRPDQVRLTHPARWGRHRREVLVAAARQAGLSDAPVLVPEPVAAATHFATLSGGALADGRALAVYDLGGGTFDIAVVARRGAGYQVLAEAGLDDLGGVDFDQAVLDHVGRTHADRVDASAWQRLLHPVDAATRRMARVLATDVRDAKEALSRYPHVDIALPPPFTDVHLTRSEFEELIRPDLSRSIDLMRTTIADSGLEPAQLAGVYLVGGSSRVPLVARLIEQGLGVIPTTLDQPETSVVTGALYLGGPAAGRIPPGPRMLPGAPPPAGPAPARFTPSAPRPGPGPLPDPRAGSAPVPPAVRPGSTPPAGDGANRRLPTRQAPHRRVRLLAGAGGGTVAAVLVIVLVLLFTNRSSPARHPVRPTGSATSVRFDRFFPEVQVRDYVRPVYGDIVSCDSSELGMGSATCTFRNGVHVTLGRAEDTVLTLAQLRELVASTVETTRDMVRQPGTWTGGALDVYMSNTGSDTALYWDRRAGGIWGLASSDTLGASQLRSWWEDHFAT